MRTGRVSIKGREYITCFSTRVLIECEERAGSVEAEMEKIQGGSITECIWLLHRLIAAGCKYAELEGMEAPEAIGYDELLDGVGIDEYSGLFVAVAGAVSGGAERNVTVESKNAQATQGI